MPPANPTNKPNQPKDKGVKIAPKRNLRIFTEALYGGVTAPSTETSLQYNTICLGLLITFLFILSLALIISGATLDIADLIILGCLFFAGCLSFCAMFAVAVCRPLCRRNKVEDNKHFQKIDITQDVHDDHDDDETDTIIRTVPKPAAPEPFSYQYSDDYYVDPAPPINAKEPPTRTDLYSARSRSRDFTATPATTKDVRFYSGEDTPPPPRLKMAGGLGDKSKSLYSMDIPVSAFEDDNRTGSEMGQLELM